MTRRTTSLFSELQALLANLRTTLSASGDVKAPRDGGVPGPTSEDEARIYAIVQDHGGRVRQQTIVEETRWSPSKVSTELSRMESNGCIGRITTGREKIVVLPEFLPGRDEAE